MFLRTGAFRVSKVHLERVNGKVDRTPLYRSHVVALAHIVPTHPLKASEAADEAKAAGEAAAAQAQVCALKPHITCDAHSHTTYLI